MRKHDTVEQRWRRLAPHVRVFGPADDRPRPAALLFHGCGGLRDHLPVYAEAAKKAGLRAFVVDSYAPRGWGRAIALGLVCTGAIFRGDQRAGDVLAAIAGVSARPDVDASQLVLAGWSHGGWGIMELMASDRRPGDIGLADPEAPSLDGVAGAFLAYPYIGIGATARMKPWRRCTKTLAVISERDHLTTVRNAEAVFGAVRGCGVEVETWVAPGTHAFDEPTGVPPMRYDAALAAEATRRWTRFLKATVKVQPASIGKPRRRRA